jgi:hypothetical protein
MQSGDLVMPAGTNGEMRMKTTPGARVSRQLELPYTEEELTLLGRVNRISPERRRFLYKRLLDDAHEQPEIMALEQILLSISGEHLVAPPNVTRDTAESVECGFLMEYPIRVNLMERNMCHLNSARLIATGKATGLCTGYPI